ncbi:hypothetical protein DYB37_007989 [Aphanomyces astaci]|uniref:Rubisco LSMT substrate-binding domain-containing protein n=1 Tax=Aphanomyces astaci TaxID=112090 RepID=A0A3R6XJZ2_APHAT|nr:hypothetical protein DYB35_008200 [Aphanomyces astaci]RHZ18385.1 hypothetical protein DYB37_007989 [Aphanomyces astaci]
MTIPSSLFISEPAAKADSTLGPIFATHVDLFTRDDPLLSTFLTYHIFLQEASFFHPYLAILPQPESILNWSMEALGQKLVDVVTRRNDEIQAWRLPWTALVPFADCLNHANVATRYDFRDDDQCFRWHSSQRHDKDQQVFNSYGRRPNRTDLSNMMSRCVFVWLKIGSIVWLETLLLDYGFALHANEWDYVDVEIATMDDFLLPKPERRRLFLAAHLMPFPSRLRLSPDTTLDEVLPYFRCASLSSATAGTSILSPQDPAVEALALTRLRDQLQAHLASFPTTLSQDAALLNHDSVACANHRTALEYRWHRKHILQRVQDLATLQLKEIQQQDAPEYN